MITSNPDCAIHPRDDTLRAQQAIDFGPILHGETLNVSATLTYDASSMGGLINCIIHSSANPAVYFKPGIYDLWGKFNYCELKTKGGELNEDQTLYSGS